MIRAHEIVGILAFVTVLPATACKLGGETGAGGAGEGCSAMTTTTSGEGGATGSTTSTVTAPPPVGCPEENIFSPKSPSTIQINDALLQGDQTWTADHTYVVLGSVDVDDGVKLTIEAGTVVCFATGAQLRVGPLDAGEIHVKGTADKHVVFTWGSSFGGDHDFWGGVQLNNYGASEIAYLDIFDAGKGGGGATLAFDISGSGPDGNAPFLLDHLTVSNVQAKGLRFGWPAGIAPGSVVTFGGYAPNPQAPISTGAIQMEIRATRTINDPSVTLAVDTAKIPQEAAFIAVDSTSHHLDEDLTWNAQPLPYRIQDGLEIYGDYTLNKTVTLTVNEGATIQMAGNLFIGNTQFQQQPDIGNLALKGSAQRPVIVTSKEASPAAGDWGSIFFVEDSFDPAVSVFDHAQIMYGGGGFATNGIGSCQDGGDEGYGLVGVYGFYDYDGPTITNSLFARSAGDGIRTHYAPMSLSSDVIKQNYGDPMFGNTFMDIAGHPFLDPSDPTADKCQ